MTIHFREKLTMLQQHEWSEKDILFEMTCDRTTEGFFLDTYIALSRQKLLIATSINEPDHEKIYRGYPSLIQRNSIREEGEWSVQTFQIKDIESVFTVNLVASGMLVMKAPQERVIALFTNGLMSKASKFAAIFEKLKQEEEPDSELLKEEIINFSCPKCGKIYPEEGREVCPKCMKKSTLVFRLLSFVRPYKTTALLVILLMLLNSATGLVIPYLTGTALFDQALKGEGYFGDQIGLVIFLIIVFRTLSLLSGVLFSTMNVKMVANVVFDLKSVIFTAMQRLSLNFFQRKQTGQLMTRVNYDSAEVQIFLIDVFSYFIVNAMNIIGITIILLVLDWKLTLLCYLPLPIVFYLVRNVFPKLLSLSSRTHRRMSAMNSIISDSIRGVRVIKAFGMEQREMQRFQEANVHFSGAEQNYNRLSGTIFPMLNALTQMGGMFIWTFGGWMVLKGEISFGLMLTFVHYMYMLYGPIEFMNNIIGWWSRCVTASQRLFEIQDANPDVKEKENATRIPDMRGEIKVTNVVFGYEPNKSILKNVTFQVKAKQMLGIVGHSGAGKSTLVNLISRLYDVNEGAITIDGVNVKDLAAESLRSNIGIVSQDVYVFSGSIAENIAYANPNCSVMDIVHAAKIANAHDFIEKLPDGYDTIVGTGGYNLSGGEKQRLSIARAILHNPKILILDEATASLDTETELQIQEALDKLIRGRTTIAIAHRLSTLRKADYLVVMDQGKVIEEGTHETLMGTDGAYYHLVKKHDEALKMSEVISV
ncbi:ATP-binding cassette domain-containing protein [Paenibacillus taichungensis]|uniref:ATP-binding cassette domain-containing protein n=3 Tax=Paenibacillus taichungensis TaxID=484184 RepID=A0ABX2MSG6_9BACL|nr:ATP-binding cassette domain-containing protein [Paenibacillus taichungensis]